jgi:hypothetical protein
MIVINGIVNTKSDTCTPDYYAMGKNRDVPGSWFSN